MQMKHSKTAALKSQSRLVS